MDHLEGTFLRRGDKLNPSMDSNFGLSIEDLKRLLDLSSSISVGLGVDEFRHKTLTLLLSMIPSHSGNFFLADREAKSINLSSPYTIGITEQALRAFEDYYQYMDPFLQRPCDQLGVTLLSEIVHREKFLQSKYYNEFLKPQGIYHQMTFSLCVGHRLVGVIALFRSSDEPPFDENEKQKAELMMPYLANGLERALIFEHTAQKTWILESSLRGHDSPGVFVLDRDMRMVFVNDAARILLGLEDFFAGAGPTGQSRMRTVLPEKLGMVCKQVAATADERNENDTEHVYWGGPEGQPLSANVTVISGHFLGQKEYFIQVRFGERYGTSNQTTSQIARQYGLSGREIDVVKEVVKGSSNADIAKNLFISIHTVENHLKRIFRKMGVKNRTQLSFKLGEWVPDMEE
jgi:DNA-binding CsgD family transcriptional regulator